MRYWRTEIHLARASLDESRLAAHFARASRAFKRATACNDTVVVASDELANHRNHGDGSRDARREVRADDRSTDRDPVRSSRAVRVGRFGSVVPRGRNLVRARKRRRRCGTASARGTFLRERCRERQCRDVQHAAQRGVGLYVTRAGGGVLRVTVFERAGASSARRGVRARSKGCGFARIVIEKSDYRK